MTEMTTWVPQQAAPMMMQPPTSQVAPASTAGLVEWCTGADAAYTVAQRLVTTPFVPDAFKHKPGEATAAILAGMEVGLQPMAALRSFDIIQGQAAMRARAQVAIVQSRGHEVVQVEATSARAVFRGRRKGSSEWQTVTWTMERARQAGLTSKPNWSKMPQSMLMARAQSEVCRLIAADALMGIGYSSEEVADMKGVDLDGAATVLDDMAAKPTSSGTRKMSRQSKPAKQAAPEPVTDQPVEGEVVDAEPVETGEAAPREAVDAMLAALNESVDPPAQPAYVGDVIGRRLDDPHSMTAVEVEKVMASLAVEDSE